jgi:hypothetical protein
MNNFNPIYNKFIDDKNAIKPELMAKGKFYLIKQYAYVDGDKTNYSLNNGPIIFTLYVSKAKDIVHAVKVSNINPNTVKKMFGKLVNTKTDTIQLKGGSRKVYENVVSSIPKITNESYRTYKLSGIKKVLSLDMDITNIIPKTRNKKE